MHLYPDHVADLPALLWRNSETRKQSLPIVGPSGNETAPAFDAFLSRLFDGAHGAFEVLGGTLRGKGEGAPLETRVIDVARTEPCACSIRPGALNEAGVRVMPLGVPHAAMPSLAYRIDSARTSVVFGSDQTGTNPKFIELAKNADVLVLHLAIGTGMTSPFQAAPDVVGRVAHDAAARSLVLSHIGQFDIDAAVADVKKSYAGPITVATDLQCVSPPRDEAPRGATSGHENRHSQRR